jgi:hypothetical protein
VLGAEVGVRVKVFEKSSQPLDLQRGSWHRPLHPEIFIWPETTAWRPVSHLPLFGWTTGRAHDVAEEIAVKFELVRTQVNKGNGKLQVCCSKKATVKHTGKVIVDGKEEDFDVVVLAVGFGVEENPFSLPWNSYCRPVAPGRVDARTLHRGGRRR